MTFTTLGYAFLGGLLPSLIWLYFMLKEDSRCPEPPKLIVLAFIVGMVTVPLVLPFEKWVSSLTTIGSAATITVATLLGWAMIEEIFKYGAAAVFILWRSAVDEPIDYIIYLITVALGFAAAENMLFLARMLIDGHFLNSLYTSDIRFLGSTMLHVVASATVGFSIAFVKLKHIHARIAVTIVGLILAIALHTAFNTLIMSGGTSTMFIAAFLVWVIAVIFLAAFEVLKYFEYRNLPSNICQP